MGRLQRGPPANTAVVVRRAKGKRGGIMAPIKWNSATGRLERQYGRNPFSTIAYAQARGANRGGNMVNRRRRRRSRRKT